MMEKIQMAKKLRTIEMGVCFTDKTWDIYPVKIPAETPTDYVEKVGCACVISDLIKNWKNHIAHIFLHSELDSEY